MSHETIGTSRRHFYVMPALPSDVLRSREFNDFFRSYKGAPFSVETRDGWCWFSSPLRGPSFTAIFSSRAGLDSVIGDSTEDSLESAFLDGQLEIRGDIFALLSVAEYVLRHSDGLSRNLIQTLSRAGLGWLKNIRHGHGKHVETGWRSDPCPSDLPVDFFERWLGPSLGNGCARFDRSTGDLDTAQTNAREQICRALLFEKDDRLLDLSCGWGSLLLHAASRWGVRGRGIAFTPHQASITADRIQGMRLETRCEAECRNLASSPLRGGAFDKLADIGLFHLVVQPSMREYFGSSYRMLRPGGLFLLHRVTRSPKSLHHNAGASHPEMPSADEFSLLSCELEAAESAGLQVMSVQDLSADYRQTVHHWIEELQRMAQSRPASMDRQSRTWLFHLLDTATRLDGGNIQLQQILLCRPMDDSVMPRFHA